MPDADDPLDRYIDSASQVLNLPVAPQWRDAIKANLKVTLAHAANVASCQLPDDAEPAPIFEA